MSKEYLYLDDYVLGEKMVSPARTVTEADIIAFAGITGDWHPLHTDAEYAAGTPFRGRIAHGMLTAGLISAGAGAWFVKAVAPDTQAAAVYRTDLPKRPPVEVVEALPPWRAAGCWRARYC